jgi:outer membrane protein OmpA-like peptidoglycan-associated protein
MRIGLIFGVLALTALVFFTAIQTLPVEASRSVAQSEMADAVDQETYAKAVEENSSLRAALAELEEKNSTLLSDLDGARTEKEQLELNLAALQATEAQTAELKAQDHALLESLTALQDELSESKKSASAFQSEAQAKAAEISLKSEKIAALEASITELERVGEASAQKASELETALNEKIASADVTAQTDVIAERDSAVKELAALKKENEEQAQVTTEMVELVNAMKSRMSELQADLSEQEDTIVALNASIQAPTVLPATICQARSDALTGAISFAGGATAISDQTAGLLNELTEVVSECLAQDVLLEIEGHTDNAGGVASNLLLSNGRANAVLAFLEENGIPSGSMRAVGYGASDPVADNATPEGRSQNERIVFDWEMK